VEVVASLSQGRTAAAQCGLFTYKSVPVIFEPPCISNVRVKFSFIYCEVISCDNLLSVIFAIFVMSVANLSRRCDHHVL